MKGRVIYMKQQTTFACIAGGQCMHCRINVYGCRDLERVMDEMQKRVLEIGAYICEENATVRDAAKKFGVSKSTVHKDITEKLIRVNPAMYYAVRNVLDKNKAERHMRGGEATKVKYMNLRKNSG